MTNRAASLALALSAGLAFGIGLLVSGMTQPAKVIGFLDVTRAWDPSLGFVMAGAVTVYAILMRRIVKTTPWLDGEFHLPARRAIDAPLVGGAAIFGVGWGLAGFCPGPALVAAAGGAQTALVFVVAMLAGMMLAGTVDRQ